MLLKKFETILVSKDKRGRDLICPRYFNFCQIYENFCKKSTYYELMKKKNVDLVVWFRNNINVFFSLRKMAYCDF